MIQIKKSLYDYSLIVTSSLENGSGTGERYVIDCITGEKRLETEAEKKERYLNDSLSRSKRVAIDYCKNNIFTHFVTITFDSSKVDVTDTEMLRKRILKYFNNFKNRHDYNFKYIIVPEYGEKNGRIHFHGMVYQENVKYLKHLAYGDYFEENLFNNFGSCKWRKIKNYDSRLQNYISKYITKDLIRCYKCSYFCSKGLKRSKVVYSNVRNTLQNYKPTMKDRLVKCLVSWLEENNLFIHTDYCDIFTMSIQQYNDFIESHNFVVNRKYKKYTFNDLFMYERGCL